MIPNSDKLSDYLRYYFTSYLPQHRDVSPNTVAGYKQTFLQLLRYWKLRFPEQLNPDLGQFQVAPLLDFFLSGENSRQHGLDAQHPHGRREIVL